MPCTCESTPTLEVGSKIHCKTIFENRVRVGGAEDKYIRYISDHWVVFDVYRRTGEFIVQIAVTRREFEQEYELCPG
jgi:hypothetical protein